MPIQEYIKNTFSSSSVPLYLKKNKYEVELFPLGNGLVYFSKDTASNYLSSDTTSGLVRDANSSIKDIQQLYDVTLFRYLPQFIKEYIFNSRINSGNDKIRDQIFVDQIPQSKAISGEYKFKYIHLYGAHPPFNLNENLDYEELGSGRDAYKTQAKAGLEIAKRFIDSLKNIGAYDNSMIFIVGDHGFGSFEVNVKSSGYKENIFQSKYSIPQKIIASGIPLVLVKPFDHKDELKVSDAPVSLSDIPKTIMSSIGLESDFSGISMFDVKEGDSRERRFLYYSWLREYWDKDYLPPMDEYIVNGFSWLSESWRPTYRQFTPEGIKVTKPEVYKFGSIINCTKEGNFEKYKMNGWSSSEKTCTWTKGKRSSIVVPIDEIPSTDLIFKVTCRPFLSVANSIKEQRVKIYINGKQLGEWNVNKEGEYEITIPRENITDLFVKIDFELPDAISPYSIGYNTDTRILALAVKKIIIEKLPN